MLCLTSISDKLVIIAKTEAHLGHSSSEGFYHVVLSVYVDLPLDLKTYAPFRCTAFDYTCADWNSFYDHIRDVPMKDVFNLSAPADNESF